MKKAFLFGFATLVMAVGVVSSATAQLPKIKLPKVEKPKPTPTPAAEPAAETTPFRSIIVCGVMGSDHAEPENPRQRRKKARANCMQMNHVGMQEQPRVNDCQGCMY